MKILGIDSSGLTASVALVEDEITVAEYTVDYKKTHSQTLLPMLDEIIKMTQQDMNEIDGIAISQGPGSFTGLRIGSATSKGLAQALRKPIIPVDTLAAMAAGVYTADMLICPLMDARRNQTYTGLYQYEKKEQMLALSCLQAPCAVPVEAILEKINTLKREVIFLGDGVPVFKEQIKQMCSVAFYFAPAYCNRQRAAVVATLGQRYYKEGKIQTPAEHAPVYLRLSQAERERKETEEKLHAE